MGIDPTSEENPNPELESLLTKLQAFEKKILVVKNALELLALCDDMPMAAHCSFMLGGIRSILLHPDFVVCEDLLRNSATNSFSPFDHGTVIEAPQWSRRLRGHLFFEPHTALFSDSEYSRYGRQRNIEYVEALEEFKEIVSENRLVVRDGDTIVGPLSQVKHLTFINIQQGWDIFTTLLATLSASIAAAQQTDSMIEYEEPWWEEYATDYEDDERESEEERERALEDEIREWIEAEEERKQNTGSFMDNDPYVLEDNIGWDKLDYEME